MDSTAEPRGTALVVDDEDSVRMCTADALEDMGYRIVEATSAEEALRALDDGLAPAILVTDHLMPGMTGAELARAVRERLPTTAIVIVSGYTNMADIAPGDSHPQQALPPARTGGECRAGQRVDR